MNKSIAKETAEILFNNQSSYIYKIALFLTKSQALADDITQDAFLQIFKKYQSYDQRKPIEPWIYKITLNTTRNALRRQRWLYFTDELPDTAAYDNIENIILKNEEGASLWEAINMLNQKSKEVIVLHYFTDMKLKDVANTLGIPLGTCKSRLNTALNTLKKQLERKNFNIKEGLYETIRTRY